MVLKVAHLNNMAVKAKILSNAFSELRHVLAILNVLDICFIVQLHVWS